MASDDSADCSPTSVDAILKDTVVIIPMLNEEGSIGLVLRDLPAVGQVIVVDNGCTDQSPTIAAECGATVVQEPQRGYGAACLRGISTVQQQIAAGEPAPVVILFVDGDYSDHPQEAVLLLEPIAAGTAQFVIGSRMRGRRESGAMPFQAAFGNHLATWLMWLFWGAKFSDLGPFRAITYQALNQLNMQDKNFGWTVEMQIKAVRQKLNYTERPVSYRRRIGVSKISGTIIGTFRAGYKILYTIFRYRLGFA